MEEFRKPMLSRLVRDIDAARLRWQVSLDQRYAQYPWEMLANSVLIGAPDIEHPPLDQVILVHPALGVELSGSRFSEWVGKETLSVEVLGYLRYRWKDRARPAAGLRWFGLSGVLTFRSDVGTGVGVMVHWNKLVNAGVVWHDFNHDGRIFNDRAAFNLGSTSIASPSARSRNRRKKWMLSWTRSRKPCGGRPKRGRDDSPGGSRSSRRGSRKKTRKIGPRLVRRGISRGALPHRSARPDGRARAAAVSGGHLDGFRRVHHRSPLLSAPQEASAGEPGWEDNGCGLCRGHPRDRKNLLEGGPKEHRDAHLRRLRQEPPDGFCGLFEERSDR